MIVGLSACSSAPDCGSSKTLDSIEKIANQNNILNDEILKNDTQNNGQLHYDSDPASEEQIKNLRDEIRGLIKNYPMNGGKVDYPENLENLFDESSLGGINQRSRNFGFFDSNGNFDTAYNDNVMKKINQYMDMYINNFDNKREKHSNNLESVESKIVYSLLNAVMTDKNSETVAVECKATLHGALDGWGEADTDIVYKVEKTTDGNLLVSLQQ